MDLLEAGHILYLVGDMLSFQYRERTRTLPEYIYNFIDDGGITEFNIKKLINSPNLIFFINFTNGLLNDDDNLGKIIEKTYKKISKNKLYKNIQVTRTADTPATSQILINLGIVYADNIDKLVDESIGIGKIISTNIDSYLSGLCVNFFVTLIKKKVKIDQWVFKLIDLLKSDIVKKYFLKSSELERYIIYVSLWKNYAKTRFSKDGELIKAKAFSNLEYRIKYFYDLVKTNVDLEFIDDILICSFTIICVAYDGLLTCNGNWEKLVYSTVLFWINSGSIACYLYGLMYGLDNVSDNMLIEVKYKDEMIKMARKMYKKYYLGEKF